MSVKPELAEIIEEAKELARRAATRGKLMLSPETVQLLSQIRSADRVSVEPIQTLDQLAQEVRACTRCALHGKRTQTVFSDGNPHAELVFVGEAPGADEDRMGVPFVGAAGQLLTDIIVKGMKMRREDVYICNVLKCRPPDNRDPLITEKEECEPFLIRQIELVKPKVICALGRHAAQTLLRSELSTGKLRGVWHFYFGIPLRVTYHPAYLLRNPADKRLTWDDIQHVMRALRGEEDPFAENSPRSIHRT